MYAIKKLMILQVKSKKKGFLVTRKERVFLVLSKKIKKKHLTGLRRPEPSMVGGRNDACSPVGGVSRSE